MNLSEEQFAQYLKSITDVGIALSAEKNHTRLLELILIKALEITHADAGTLYTCSDDKLKFEILINQSMGSHIGGTSSNTKQFADIALFDSEGNPNQYMLAPCAVNSRKTINIKDAYRNKKYDLSGTKDFDKRSGYHSQSFLTVPLTNHLNEVIGVLQLINAINPKTHKITVFNKLHQYLIESLASQAAVTITNRQLIQDQKNLFDALIELIANAIDEKSPYTGGHCRRVPIITQMLAKAACATKKGPLKHFTMTDDEFYELEVAAWLHDCGKITTPEAVVDKSTKLEEIIDGIELIDTRFEVLKRDVIIQSLKEKLKQNPNNTLDEQDPLVDQQIRQLNQERDFIRQCNIGGEYMGAEQLDAVKQIASRHWVNSENKKVPFLAEHELQLLSIKKGTLSNKERDIINNHVSVSLRMLESLPYPKNLKNVPILAGSHHEKINGTGYPLRLKEEQIPLKARIIAIADIFEALTANDRPYKKAMPLTQALSIMGQMKLDGHIDPDLFDVFVDAEIYKRYSEEHLTATEEGPIDLNKIPGYKRL